MKKIVISLFIILSFSIVSAQTFTVNGINYSVISGTNNVEVAHKTPEYEGNIVIPASVTNNNITYLVTSIGNYAFESCFSLISITIPNSITSIGNYTFSNCGLTSITIPNSVTSIGNSAFYQCSSLSSITIPNSVTSIGEFVFGQCSSLSSITIPISVTSISEYAFANCTSLTSITIPNSVTSIGAVAFYDCSSLTSVIIPNSVTSIGDFTFGYCTSLTSITLPNSVTSIGNFAFESCTGITTVTIPSSVTSIGIYAFELCANITSVICDIVTPIPIHPSVFEYYSTCSLTVPPQSYSLYLNAPVWQAFNPINGILNTENFSLNDDLKLYPNPTKGDLFITLGNFSTSHELTIIDIQGKIIHTQKLESLLTTINTRNFEKGIYFLNLIDGTQKTTKKFIIE